MPADRSLKRLRLGRFEKENVRVKALAGRRLRIAFIDRAQVCDQGAQHGDHRVRLVLETAG